MRISRTAENALHDQSLTTLIYFLHPLGKANLVKLCYLPNHVFKFLQAVPHVTGKECILLSITLSLPIFIPKITKIIYFSY